MGGGEMISSGTRDETVLRDLARGRGRGRGILHEPPSNSIQGRIVSDGHQIQKEAATKQSSASIPSGCQNEKETRQILVLIPGESGQFTERLVTYGDKIQKEAATWRSVASISNGSQNQKETTRQFSASIPEGGQNRKEETAQFPGRLIPDGRQMQKETRPFSASIPQGGQNRKEETAQIPGRLIPDGRQMQKETTRSFSASIPQGGQNRKEETAQLPGRLIPDGRQMQKEAAAGRFSASIPSSGQKQKEESKTKWNASKDPPVQPKQQAKTNKNIVAKDPVSALNEFCQKNQRGMPTFEVVFQGGPSHDPTFTMIVIIGNKKYGKRTAKSKQEAKKLAAAAACNTLGILCGYRPSKAENVKTSAPSCVEKHPVSELYEYTQALKLTQPKECLVKEYGLAHSKRFSIQFEIGGIRYKSAEGKNKDEARKLAADYALEQLRSKVKKELNCGPVSQPKTFGDYIAETSWKAYRTLCTNIREMFTFSGHVILACMLIEDTEKSTLNVISLGTGNRIVMPYNLRLDGNIILDSHAEIVARRGLLLFLYQQLNKYINRTDSVFTQGLGGLAQLKNKYRLHLYISTAPCGDAAVYSHADKSKSNDSVNTLQEHAQIADLNPQRGEIRTKVEGGEGTIPTRNTGVVTQTIDGIQMGNRMRVASCSDKILKWNVVGVQGALLSKFIQPIFLSSVTLSDLYEPKHLCRALCCRMPTAPVARQAPTDTVHHPAFHFGNIEDAKRVMDTEATKKTKSWSLYWTRGELDPSQDITTDIVNHSGLIDGTTGSHLEYSRFTQQIPLICKRKLFEAYHNICFQSRDASVFRLSYRDCKFLSTGYQEKKRQFQVNVSAKMGQWLSLPQEVDSFFSSK